MIIVLVFFHPHEPACFAICFIVDVIVGVVRHVMANAVLVTVLVAVVTVIAMAAAAFFCDVLDVIALGIFEVVLSCFKLIRTVCGVGGEAADSCGVHGEC